MKGRIALFLAALVLASGVCFAAGEPMADLESKQLRPAARYTAAPPSSEQQVQPFYGVRASCPHTSHVARRYRVIIHEIMNTLVDHVLGRY